MVSIFRNFFSNHKLKSYFSATEVKKGRPSKKQGVRIVPKTSAQRQREYRERMKEQKEANLNG